MDDERAQGGGSRVALQRGTAKVEWVWHVAVDEEGNIYVAGYTEGTLPGQANAGKADAFLVQFKPQPPKESPKGSNGTSIFLLHMAYNGETHSSASDYAP